MLSTQNIRSFYKFVHVNPIWIDIPDYFRFIKNLNKGDQYKVARDVDKVISDDWMETYVRNTGVNFINFRSHMVKMGYGSKIPKVDKDARRTKFINSGCSRHAKAQALEDIISFPSRVSELVNEARQAIPNIVDTSQAVQNLTARADEILTNLTTVVDFIKTQLTNLSNISSRIMEFITYILKIVSLAYLLNQTQNQNVTNVIALFTLIIPSSAVNCIQPFVVGLIRVIKGMGGSAAQGEEDEDNSGFIKSFFLLTLGIMKGLVGDVPKEVFDHLHISSRKTKLIADYIKGTSTIVECLLKLWEKCVELIGDKIMKYFKVLPCFLREDQLTPLVDEFMAIKTERLDVNATINKESARRVVTLHQKLFKMECDLAKKIGRGHNIRMMPYLRIMIKYLDAVIARIPDHLRTGMAPRRIKPFWVYIYGDPRIGKTAVFQPYIANALSQKLRLNTKYEDYTNYTYLRNCGEDYWEGYDNHPILWYNDLFQNFADEPAMHKAIMELTNVVDDNVYPLEMAFERKHCVYFNSELVVSNAQDEMIRMPFIANKCWSGGAHLYARRNICVHMSVNPLFRDDNVGINYTAMRNFMEQNPQDCVGFNMCNSPEDYSQKLLFPKSLYILTFTDPNTGNVIRQTDFERGVEYMEEQAELYQRDQNNFKDKLYKHFEERWKARAQAEDDDEFEDAPLMTDAMRQKYVSDRTQMVLDAMIASVPELIESEDYALIQQIRMNVDGGVDYANILYAGQTNESDAFIRMHFIVETTGIDYWMNKKITWWHRFKLRFSTALERTRKSALDCLNQVVGGFPGLIQFVTYTMVAYVYYRVIRVYYSYLNGVYVKQAKIELMHEQTMRQQQQVVDVESGQAQTAEGKQKPKVAQIVRIKKKPQAVAMSYDDQNVIVENKVSRQMCKFSLHVFDGDDEVHMRMFGSGICVGSDVFIIPYHFWFRFCEMRNHWESHNLTVKLRLHWNEKLAVFLNWDSITTCKLEYSHCEDLIFIRIERLVQKPHIKHFFVKQGDRPTLFEMYLYGMRAQSFTITSMQVQNGVFEDTIYEHESRDDPIYGGKFQKRTVVLPVSVKYYNCMSAVGDCGLLLMNCDSSTNCRKIVAMHTAGHTSENYGIGSLICQEDIDEAFGILYKDEPIIQAVAMEYDTPPEYAKDLEDLGLVVLGKLPRIIEPEFKINKQPCIMLPRKSKINRSVVYTVMEQDFGPTTVAPAHLRPFTNAEGEKVFPILKALKKMVTCSPSPTKKECDIIRDHIAESLMTWRSPYDPFVLTDEQMLNGVGNLNPIELATSPGYPYVMLDNTAGKHPYFENEAGVITMKPYIFGQIKDREDKAKNGIIKDSYFIDTLKDETRELHKVAAGKTRLFQIAPMDLNILLRKYFGAFLMHMRATYIEGEGAVGINANSMQWTDMIKYHLVVGDDFINGDGENYDASISQRIGMYNCEAINKWYQTGKDWQAEHDLVRFTLYATFLNSKHIYRDVVYQALQGNKSGITVTTEFNIMMGMFSIRLAYLRLYDSMTGFHKAVRPKFYGDDDLITINRVVAPGLTCKYYKQVLQTVGIVYTSASKSDIVDGWYNITEITFLKRAFVFDGVRYLPQLDHRVVMEIARWSESDPTIMVDQMNRFNSALLEISNYGRDEFNNLRNKFVVYCALLNKAGFTILTTDLFIYEYCEKIKWGDLYSPSQLHFDLAKRSDDALVVQNVGCDNDVKLSPLGSILGLEQPIVQQTATSQTYEGKAKSSKPQIIRTTRPPKAQGEEEEESKDFNAYLVMMDYLRELKPCIDNFNRALLRVARKPETRWAFAVLHTKVALLIRIYNECIELISGEGVVAQGEEHDILPQRERFKTPAIETQLQTVQTTSATEGQDVKQDAKTTFIDYNAPHQPPAIHTTIPHFKNSNLGVLEDNYFHRPIAVETFSWASTDAIWTSKGKWTFPTEYFKDNTYLKNKAAMIAYMRPDFEITVTVNATRFHYGRLIFVVQPFAKDDTWLPSAYDRPQNATTWPHWYQLSAGPRQTVRFVIPYRHIVNQLALDDLGAFLRHMFAIRCYVMVPLQSANGTAAPVEVTVFAAMIKPQFAGSRITAAISQGEEVSLSEQGLTVNNPLGAGRSGVVTGSLMGVSNLTRDVAHFTNVVGMSTPINLASTSSMQIRQPLLNKCDDLPNSVILGPSQDARVIPSREFVNSESDDMNINHIISSPCLLKTLKVQSTSAGGTVIWSTELTPDTMIYSGEWTDEAGTNFPLPVNYLGRLFQYWRGSWKFHFSAVSSGFHSMRLRVIYIPGSTANTIPTVTSLISGSIVRNVVWDINDTSDLTVEVPYESVTEWCTVRNTNGVQSISGGLYLQVINPLTSAASDINPIYIQIFVACADDFQFAVPDPSAAAFAPDIYVAPATTLQKQSGLISLDCNYRARAQGEERESCSIPASSSVCLREQRGIFMGDRDGRHRVYNESQAYVYTSLKQLCQQLCPIDFFESKTTDTKNITGRVYTPYGSGWKSRKWDDDFWNSYLHMIIPLFRFMRGGFRVHVAVNDKVQATATAQLGLASAPAYGTDTDPDTLDYMNGTMPIRKTRYGSAFFYDNSVYPIDVTVPYYNAYPCLVTYNSESLISPLPPYVTIGLSTQKAAKKMIMYVAAADDLMLGYRLSIPRIRYANAPATLQQQPQSSTSFYVDVDGSEYRYDYSDGNFHPADVHEHHVSYFFGDVKDVGRVWTEADRKWPSKIDGNVLLILSKFKTEKPLSHDIAGIKKKRSLVEKILGGQLTDFSESD